MDVLTISLILLQLLKHDKFKWYLDSLKAFLMKNTYSTAI